MSLYHLKRTWKTDSSGVYFQTKLYIGKFPIVRVERRSDKKVYILGLLVWKQELYKRSSEEKLNHLIKIGYDPRKLPSAQGLPRLQQLASVQLLRKVDAVCRKHGIRWWMDFGTLLGAVRHGGFIPWDDDIDIAMLREDWERFRDLFKQEFDAETFSMNNMGFLQVHCKGLPVQVDIFPYDRASEAWDPDDQRKESEFLHKIQKCASLLEYNIDLSCDQDYCVVSHSYEQVRELSDNIMCNGKKPADQGQIFLAIDAPQTPSLALADRWIFPLGTEKFEGFDFPVPANPELVLYKSYGDWGSLPDNPVVHFSLEGMSCSKVERMLRISREGL